MFVGIQEIIPEYLWIGSFVHGAERLILEPFSAKQFEFLGLFVVKSEEIHDDTALSFEHFFELMAIQTARYMIKTVMESVLFFRLSCTGTIVPGLFFITDGWCSLSNAGRKPSTRCASTLFTFVRL